MILAILIPLIISETKVENVLNFKGYYSYYSKSIDQIIFIPPKNVEIIIRLENILEQER